MEINQLLKIIQEKNCYNSQLSSEKKYPFYSKNENYLQDKNSLLVIYFY